MVQGLGYDPFATRLGEGGDLLLHHRPTEEEENVVRLMDWEVLHVEITRELVSQTAGASFNVIAFCCLGFDNPPNATP